jgi:hypothetical protein
MDAYLPAINPLVDFALSNDGRLSFRNAAVDAGVSKAPSGGYSAVWAAFDNATGDAKPLGAATTSQSTEIQAPAAISSAGPFVRAQVSAVGASREEWKRPFDVFFQRTGGGWRLVGLTRLP